MATALPPPRSGGNEPESNKERAQRLFKELRAQLNSSRFRETLAAMTAKEFRTTGYVDQLCEGVFLACRDNADLLTCDRASLFRAVERVAKSGLKVGAGGYWLVPYKGQVQEQLDYRGALTMVRRSRMVRKISAQAVYENDECEILLGTEERITHKPALTNRGDWIAVYAFAVVDGVDTPEVELMDRAQIEDVRSRAPSKNSPAWRDNAGEMARKIVLKRLCKRLPMEDPDSLKDMDDRVIEGVGEALNVDLAAPALSHQPEEAINVVEEIDAETGEVREPEPVQAAQEPRQEAKPARQAAGTVPPPRARTTAPQRQEEPPPADDDGDMFGDE